MIINQNDGGIKISKNGNKIPKKFQSFRQNNPQTYYSPSYFVFLTTLPYIEKYKDGFDGHLYPNHFQKEKRKQAPRLGVESKNVKRTRFP